VTTATRYLTQLRVIELPVYLLPNQSFLLRHFQEQLSEVNTTHFKLPCTVLVFQQRFAIEDAIESHNMLGLQPAYVQFNNMPLRLPFPYHHHHKLHHTRGRFIPDGQAAIENIDVTFADFPASVTSMTCFNSGGIDAQGNSFAADISVQPNQIKSLWIGMSVPPTLTPGSSFSGTVKLVPQRSSGGIGASATTITTTFTVSEQPAIVKPTVMARSSPVGIS
jgi:hypothetical protein